MFCVAKINPFAELNAEDMSELVEKYDGKIDPKQLEAIKEKTFCKAGLERKKSFSSIKVIRIAIAAAAVFVVVLSAVITLSVIRNKPKTAAPTTVVPSSSVSDTNPLITAISKGDDKLIGSLLENSVFVNEDVLSYAMKYRNLLSYRSISNITKAVKEKFGMTGLDPLVENAVLGNSAEVVRLLQSKESLGSLNDKIAYFFSAAFCSGDTLRLFNEKGIEIGTTDTNGDTIYEIAKKYGNTENQKYALNMDMQN